MREDPALSSVPDAYLVSGPDGRPENRRTRANVPSEKEKKKKETHLSSRYFVRHVSCSSPDFTYSPNTPFVQRPTESRVLVGGVEKVAWRGHLSAKRMNDQR